MSCDENEFVGALFSEDFKAAKKLMETLQDPYHQWQGWSPLSVAVASGFKEAIECWSRRGFDLGKPCECDGGQTSAMAIALGSGQSDIAKTLEDAAKAMSEKSELAAKPKFFKSR